MSINIESLGIDRLSVSERLELIEMIWDTLPEQVAPANLPERHREMLAQRRAEAERDPGRGKPWRDVLDSFGR